MSEKVKPLSATDIFGMANRGDAIPADRALATYADPSNWVQIYNGKTVSHEYEAKACEWAFIGPMRPGYELARHATDTSVNDYIERVKKSVKLVSKGETETWGFVSMFFEILDGEKR